MAVGLTVFADNGGAQGVTLVNTTDTVLNIVGQTQATGNFTITSSLFSNGTFWYMYTPNSDWTGSTSPAVVPSVSYSNNTMTVTGSGFDGVFTYGYR